MNGTATQAKVIYVLYLAALLNGVTMLIGVVMAYLARGDAPEWLGTHYRFQIRTFWMGLLYSLLATMLTPVLIGLFGFLLIAVWLIVRCVKGLKAADREEPVESVESWLF
ncbi:MAG: hypothetical protein GWM88_11085 [Pseudomonadales bacterium]|nr:hypothetical protein [Pseudomonadales bacterium]NIX08512.1 hypothetical protein [Pseudomonadales bacterium]